MKKFFFWLFITSGFLTILSVPVSYMLSASIGRALLKPFVGEKIILSDIQQRMSELTIGASTCADIEALFATSDWDWSKSDLVTKGYAEVYAKRFGSDVVYQPPIHLLTTGIMLKLYVDDACTLREIELYEFAK